MTRIIHVTCTSNLILLHMVMRHEVAPFCVTCQFGLSRDILTFELEYFLK